VTKKDNDKLSRRQFLARTVKAGASIAAASAASYVLYNPDAPKSKQQSQELVTFPDFSVPHRQGKTMSIVTGANRTETSNKAIESLGGIERFVKSGETVLIKPNAAFASPSSFGATTNPELIANVIRLCYDKGNAKRVIVTDNPINDPASCFQLSGIGKAAADAGADVKMPKPHYFKETTLAGGRLIKNWPVLYAPFEKIDKVIGITPLKDHHRSGASMTMKNWYGLLGGRRNIFHQNINAIIAELATMMRPTLVILDATEVMIANGPTGGSASDLKRTNTMIASTDQVAADSFGCSLLNLSVADLPYLTKAQHSGAGTTDYKSLKPVFAQVIG
jgi:uncharacterized protein (DUF362 family)